MFSRIYSGIFLSVAVAAALCFAVYKWSFAVRYPLYEERALSGTLQLLSDSLEKQSEGKREKYLDIVASLMDASHTVVPIAQYDKSIQDNIVNKIPQRLASSDQLIQWCLPLDALNCIKLSIAPLSEQHYRAMAILFVTELSRRNNPISLEGLQTYSPFLLSVKNLNGIDADAQQLSRLKNGSVVVSNDTDQSNSFSVHVLLPDARVFSINSIERFSAFPLALVISMLCLLGFTVGIACYFMVKSLERKLDNMSQTIEWFGEGSLQVRSEMVGADAVSRVSQQFNAMATRVEQLIESERTLVRAASHELRTPLSRMRFRLEELESHAALGPDETSVSGLRTDIHEIQCLVDELLAHDQLNAAVAAELRDCVPDKVVGTVVELLSPLYPAVEIQLALDASEAMALDEKLFQRVASNLLENACKYTGRVVRVSTRFNAGQLLFSVEDDGPGIAVADRERIFETFYRVNDDSRARRDGFGIGLATVKRIVDLHGGTVEVSDSELSGAQFTVKIGNTDARA